MRKIAGAYRDMSLWKKMLLGYVLVIVLPFMIFIAALEDTYDAYLDEVYLFNEQRGMQQEYSNLTARLNLLQSYNLLFQNDKSVNRYMNGHYRFIGDEIVGFLTDIRPLFAFINTSAPDVNETVLYCLKKPLVPLPKEIVYRPEMAEYVESLDKEGRWFFEQDGSGGLLLKYQAPLYAYNYSKLLGMFEMTVNGDIPTQYISEAESENDRYLLTDGTWYKIADGSLEAIPQDSSVLSGKGILVNRMNLPELDAELISVTSGKALEHVTVFGAQTVAIAVLFVLLSALYYLIISSFGKRLHLFSKHISKMSYDTLTVFEKDKSKDEIGQLVNVYNTMIARIKELVSDLNIAELKKREADYLALQAQMRPHFLYNSLETARMMADSNDDEEVGDFLYNLGGFIRYSFTSAGQSVSLTTELETVRKYLSIYKASMGDALDYKLDISGDISDVSCPAFIVQPLVENCLRHGMGPDSLQISVRVSAFKEERKTVVTVSDNGKGITAEQLNRLKEGQHEKKPPIRGSGLGISNTKKRLADYFQGRADFEIESEPGIGTVCTITIKDSVI